MKLSPIVKVKNLVKAAPDLKSNSCRAKTPSFYLSSGYIGLLNACSISLGEVDENFALYILRYLFTFLHISITSYAIASPSLSQSNHKNNTLESFAYFSKFFAIFYLSSLSFCCTYSSIRSF